MKGKNVYIVGGNDEMCYAVLGVFEDQKEAEDFVKSCEDYDEAADYDDDVSCKNHPSGLQECYGFEFYSVEEQVVR